MKLVDKIVIYGNHFFLLAEECYGCYHFNYLCVGPCSGRCHAQIFEFDKYQAYTEYLLETELNGNLYLLGRLFELDVQEHLEKLKTKLEKATDAKTQEAFREMINDAEEALAVPESILERVRQAYYIDEELEVLDPIIDKFLAKMNLDGDGQTPLKEVYNG